MKENVLQFIQDLKQKPNTGFDRFMIRQGVVLRMLNLLGWDVYDANNISLLENYQTVASDVVLNMNSLPCTLICISNEMEDTRILRQFHKLLNNDLSLKCIIITDGNKWTVYSHFALEEHSCLPIVLISIKDSSLYQIDELCAFLDFSAYADPSCFEERIEKYSSKAKESERVASNIKKLWNTVIETRDARLIALIQEAASGLYGWDISTDSISAFIKQNENCLLITKSMEMTHDNPPDHTETPSRRQSSSSHYSPVRRSVSSDEGDPTNRRPKTLFIGDDSFYVNSWRDVLIKTCDFFLKKYGKKFEEYAQVNVHGNCPYFSYEKAYLRKPEKLDNSRLYVETNFSAVRVLSVVNRLKDAFQIPLKLEYY